MKKIFVSLLWIAVALLLVLAVYFSFKTKGDVATMVAGLWSALATVVLGLIALNQSRQYKNLSDKATQDYQDLQIEIKNLNGSMAEAIDTLKRIEKAKYYPNLEDWHYHFFGMGRESYIKMVEDMDYVVQLNYLNVSEEDISKDFTDVIGDYNVFAFRLKNAGEKAIRNFNCKNISFPSITDSGGHFIINCPCDIKPGQFVLVCLINIPGYLSMDGINVEMSFRMENLISEIYGCQADITFYNYKERPNVNIDFINPTIYTGDI